MYGVKDLVRVVMILFRPRIHLFCQFWGPGNFELFVLSPSVPRKHDSQLFVIPFAKSATTGQHPPVNGYLGWKKYAYEFADTASRTTRAMPSCNWTTVYLFTEGSINLI
jgi:hypothetical protein